MRRFLTLVSVATVVLLVGGPAWGADPPGGSAGPTQAGDQLRASNVVPPGESGDLSVTDFAGVTAGLPGARRWSSRTVSSSIC